MPDDPSSSAASIPGPESLDPESVIDSYELVRLPRPPRTGRVEPAANLLALIDRYDAFILDGYGVINVGPEPIPGIGDTIRALRAAGREVMVLTNGSGRPSRQTVRRYEGWGLGIPGRLVVSSRDALEASLAARPRPGLWGVMAQPDSDLDALTETTMTCHGKTFAVRGNTVGLAGRIARYIGVRLSGTVRQVDVGKGPVVPEVYDTDRLGRIERRHVVPRFFVRPITDCFTTCLEYAMSKTSLTSRSTASRCDFAATPVA